MPWRVGWIKEDDWISLSELSNEQMKTFQRILMELEMQEIIEGERVTYGDLLILEEFHLNSIPNDLYEAIQRILRKRSKMNAP